MTLLSLYTRLTRWIMRDMPLTSDERQTLQAFLTLLAMLPNRLRHKAILRDKVCQVEDPDFKVGDKVLCDSLFHYGEVGEVAAVHHAATYWKPLTIVRVIWPFHIVDHWKDQIRKVGNA